MSALTFVLFVAGLILLLVGAELLVRGASKLAAAAGISPLIIGLTVVAFCTGSPELAVSVQAAFEGQGDLALGNVIGSNLFNVLFILGLSAIVAPLVVRMQLIRLDVPIMIAASVAVFLFGLSGSISRLAGVLLFVAMLAYTGFLIWQAKRERNRAVQEQAVEEFGGKPHRPIELLGFLGFIVAGLAMLIVGSNWMVDGAISLARSFGVSDVLIGLTIVAAGTSLPEIATSVMASVRGERDIAVGNVIGSNIFNILGVLGLTAALSPNGVAVPIETVQLEIPAMVLVTIACVPIFFVGLKVTRIEGALLFAYYVLFTLLLILKATNSAFYSTYSLFLLFSTSVTFAFLFWYVWRQWRRRKVAGIP